MFNDRGQPVETAKPSQPVEVLGIDGLPEGFAALVETADGKHTLDLTKLMVKEDVTSLKNALSQERENVSAWAKLGESPAKVQAFIDDLKKQKAPKGRTEEEQAAMIQQVKDEYEGKLEKANDTISTLRRGNAAGTLKGELAKQGVTGRGLDALAMLADNRIKFGDDGSLKILTDGGKPMVGTGDDHGATMADLAKELATAFPEFVKDGGTGGGGKPPADGGGKPGQKTVTRTQWDNMSTLERSAHAKEGGSVVDG